MLAYNKVQALASNSYIQYVMISWVREQRYRALLIKQLAINE